jgi:hypothetical protein
MNFGRQPAGQNPASPAGAAAGGEPTEAAASLMGSNGSTPESSPPPTEGAQAVYKKAFANCAPTLDVVAKSSSEEELEATCGWWRACMAKALPECHDLLAAWRQEARGLAAGGGGLGPSQMVAATASSLPWAALATCVERQAAAAVSCPGCWLCFPRPATQVRGVGQGGAQTAVTLQHVATEGGVGSRMRAMAQREWVGAARACEPMRRNMQSELLGRAGTTQRDEVLTMMVWMYGLATQLQKCKASGAAPRQLCRCDRAISRA